MQSVAKHLACSSNSIDWILPHARCFAARCMTFKRTRVLRLEYLMPVCGAGLRRLFGLTATSLQR